MYIIKNCSIVVSLAICYIISTIIRLISFTCSISVLMLLVAVLIADTVLYKIKDKKCYLSAVVSIVSVITHLIIADINIVFNKKSLVGLFLFALSILIAFCYRNEHTLGNTPIFQDAVFGKQAGEIASILQYISSIIILHAIIYIDSLSYVIISFTLITFLVVFFTQLIILPEYKKYKKKEKDELIAQIKKEQGYR